MPRNPVQFQKGMSDADFDRLYGTESQCREALFAWRWPKGFTCPVCGGAKHSVIETRARYQCSLCRSGNDISLHQAAAENVVSRHLPYDAKQRRHIQPGTCPASGRYPKYGLETVAQAYAGHARTRSGKAPYRQGGNGRCLYRRQAKGQTGSGLCWEDAFCGGC